MGEGLGVFAWRSRSVNVLFLTAAGAPSTQYVWSNVYVDAMIERDRDTDANGTLDERLYTTYDANFNVTALVNVSGLVVERYIYDPYGKQTVLDPDWSADADNTSDFDFHHGFQGGRMDPSTGKIDFRNRQYDPETQRWMTADPMEYIDGTNRFLALKADPSNMVDPQGLAVIIAPDGYIDGNLLTQGEMEMLYDNKFNGPVRWMFIDERGHRIQTTMKVYRDPSEPADCRDLDEALHPGDSAFELAIERQEEALNASETIIAAATIVHETLAEIADANPLVGATTAITGTNSAGMPVPAMERASLVGPGLLIGALKLIRVAKRVKQANKLLAVSQHFCKTDLTGAARELKYGRAFGGQHLKEISEARVIVKKILRRSNAALQQPGLTKGVREQQILVYRGASQALDIINEVLSGAGTGMHR